MFDEKLLKDFFEKINKMEDKNNFLQEILVFLKKITTSDSIGIRLKSKGDYPYYTTLGFTNYFVKMENFLCKKTKNKGIKIDKDGMPIYECMCGAIITGNIDLNAECFTKFGSFVTNNSTDLAVKNKDFLQKYYIRGRCGEMGYKSILLVPISIGKTNVGLIQLNSFRADAYGKDVVKVVEKTAANLGITLQNIHFIKQSEDETAKQIIKKNIFKIIASMQGLTQKILKK
jgi:hypothetical protein